MKKIIGSLLAVGLLIGVEVSFAQPMPNANAEAQWQRYLSNHPGLAEHPQWLNNPKYMSEHPNMAKWLQQHPRVREEARNQGMWDREGRWHDPDWWRDHHPNQMYQYHPEWAENHPNWRGPNDGDWDDHHHWHNRAWWQQNDRAWVEKHHPNWFHHDHDND
jgi:hypothetical protein